MKIRISTLTVRGLEIRDFLNSDSLNERLNNIKKSGVIFKCNPVVTLTARKNVEGAEVFGKIFIEYEQECSRCSDPLPRSNTRDFYYIIKHNSAGEKVEDDVGIIFYTGEYVDLQSALEETIIIDLDIFWSPSLDKNDSCTLCGRAKQKSISAKKEGKLNELFKKAGIN